MLSRPILGCCVSLGVFVGSLAFHTSVGILFRNNHFEIPSKWRGASHHCSSIELQMVRRQTQSADVLTRMNGTDASSVGDVRTDEAQILLACRAYLSRKNILKWQRKKVRREAAMINEGYFWSDPDELVYLRDSPDPFNVIDNETVIEEVFKYAYNMNSASLENESESVEYSTNPFSTHPLYPSKEHIRRSESRAHLWSNETWKDAWYEKRWKGRKLTNEEKRIKRVKRRVDNMPSDLLEAPEFASLTDEEVVTATLSYIRTREKMADTKRKLKEKQLAQREELRQWRRALREEAEGMALLMKTTNSTRRDIVQKSVPLTFDTSPDIMTVLKAKRSIKAKRAYKRRSDAACFNEPVASATDMMKFKAQYSSVEIGSNTSIQAILRIANALSDDQLPSANDIKTILKPGRLRGRKQILLRVLDECFGLKGKCIPKQVNGEQKLQFATTCSIQHLGQFVISMLQSANKA